MKPLITSRSTLLLFLSCLFHLSFATGGSIMGHVTDPETKAPVADAIVTFDCMGMQHVCYTNDSGYYYASNIPAGIYTIVASYTSNSVKLTNIQLANDETREVNLQLGNSVIMTTVVYTGERNPLIDPLGVPNSDFLQQKDIKNMPITVVDDIGETLGNGLVKINGEFYDRGARAGSLSYYIDECKVMGSPDIPLCGLETYRSYTGFIPPKYGDTNGGVIVIETRSYFTSLDE